jgi:hypothetical protein
LYNYDIHPCEGNEVLNLFDIYVVLHAIEGQYDCNCAESLMMGSGDSDGGSAEVGLTAKVLDGERAGAYEVDVSVANFVDLRGYEIALDVTGGESGELRLEEVRIDRERKDYVFAGLDASHAIDLSGGRVVCVAMDQGVAGANDYYAATFVYRPSGDAKGTFTIAPKGNECTLAADTAGQALELQVIGGTQITLD